MGPKFAAQTLGEVNPTGTEKRNESSAKERGASEETHCETYASESEPRSGRDTEDNIGEAGEYTVFVLLLRPSDRVFELVEAQYDPSSATVGGLLRAVAKSAEDRLLGNQFYSGLIRRADGAGGSSRSGNLLTNLADPVSYAVPEEDSAGDGKPSAGVQHGEILVAVPEGCSPDRCRKLARIILRDLPTAREMMEDRRRNVRRAYEVLNVEQRVSQILVNDPAAVTTLKPDPGIVEKKETSRPGQRMSGTAAVASQQEGCSSRANKSNSFSSSCERYAHTVEVGDIAPDFTLPDVEGRLRSLSDYRGRKVMLSFHRYAACPFCNFAIEQLQGRYKKLAWAAKLEVIKVFQSTVDNVKKHVLRDIEASEYPFILLSDPEEATYKAYSVRRSLSGVVVGVARARTVNRQSFREMPRPKMSEIEGSRTQLCADFLINESGKVVDYFRSSALDQHLPLDRINLFLLGESSSRSVRPSEVANSSMIKSIRSTLRLSSFSKTM